MDIGGSSKGRLSAVIALALLIPGCIGALDIFVPSKPLVGDFRLVQFDDQNYYVERGNSSEPGGVLAGTIERIGWNDKYIVAWRSAMLGNVQSGWMIIDVKTGASEGPLSDESFRARSAGDEQLRAIPIQPVREAWRRD
jgi:hypothetical protein